MVVNKEKQTVAASLEKIMHYDTEINITWCVEDIDTVINDYKMIFSPPLTEQEKAKALNFVKTHHDANIGICWDTLKIALEILYENRIVK